MIPFLQDPVEISLPAASHALLDEVDLATASLEEHRPFSPDVSARLQSALLPTRVVATLNMEGIAATRRQTLMVMDAMRMSESLSRAPSEIENVLLADEFIHDLVERNVPLSEGVVRELNRILRDGVDDDAGIFRSGAVELPGAPFQPPEAIAIPSLMREYCTLFRGAFKSHALVHAAWAHAQFTKVHPFSDGNGRTGRLLQDYTLISRGLLPVGIPTSRRDEYYDALADADSGKWRRLVELLAVLQLACNQDTLRIVTEPERRAAWIGQLARAANEEEHQRQERNYAVWRLHIDSLLQELKTVAHALTESSNVIEITFTRFDECSQATWNELGQGSVVSQRPLASLEFALSGENFYRTAFYIAPHTEHENQLFDSQVDLVCVYIDGLDPRDSKSVPKASYDDPHIRLREIAFVGGNIFVFQDPLNGEDWDCTDDMTIADIVEDFFKDIFRRKVGLNV